MAIGTNLNNIDANTTMAAAANNASLNFLLNKNGVYINGQGRFTGEVRATAFYLNGSNTPVATTEDG